MLLNQKKRRWNTSSRYLNALVFPVVIFTLLLTFLIAGITTTSRASARENREFLEAAVQKAIVQCYAIEGMYPPTVTYLEDHYGIQIDHDRFIVHYEIFASNILPTVAVIVK